MGEATGCLFIAASLGARVAKRVVEVGTMRRNPAGAGHGGSRHVVQTPQLFA